ncbi:MAG: hypothetical protein U9P10_13940 [Thermodesulfobacteriota bacterium]|nr:hypothetical protein [Thermodesulfobacteriota bacterium]
MHWDDTFWYHAEVTDVSSDRIRVHYTGYDNSYDEWVKQGAAVPELVPQMNDTVWALWRTTYSGKMFHETRIIDINSTGYKVHYTSDGSDTTWDEWKTPCEIFPLPQPGDYLWVGASVNSWAYGRVIEHTDTDTWKVYYGGYDKWGSWHEYDGSFSPPDIMPATPDEQKYIKEEFSDHSPVAPPTGSHVYSFYPVESPDILDNFHIHTPSKIKPIGLGKAVKGGDTMDVSFDIPHFTEPVNVYFAMTMGSLNEIFLFGKDNAWHHYGTEGLVPAFEGKKYLAETTAAENINITQLAGDTYYFYLLVCKGSDLANNYTWVTSFSVNQNGHYTGKKVNCTTQAISALITPIIQEMESKGDATWYDQLKTYVTDYKNADEEADPGEALNKIILAAYGSNNVYPFCWAALKKVALTPWDTWSLNTAAVALLELDRDEEAGMLLDCAWQFDPDFSITYANAGVYYAEQGKVIKALESFDTASGKSPQNPHRPWDAYHYAAANSQAGYQSRFLDKIPENYSLVNNDGSTGKGEKQLIVCCNCNGSVYYDLGTCLDECTVTLACFTHICTPRLECCGGSGPFGFNGGFCYPPKGLQVCIDVDNQGKTTLKVGGDLAEIMSGYIGASSDFKNNHTLFLEGSAAGGASQHTLTMLTTDPKTKNWSSQHQLTMGKSLGGGLAFGANTQPSQWTKSVLCEFYTPP